MNKNMTIRQKRAIGYAIRQRERENQLYFIMYKNLLDDFNSSKYKSTLWYIKSKDLLPEYRKLCYRYDNKLADILP